MTSVEIRRAINGADVAEQASQFITEKLEHLLEKKTTVHFCLTGGTVGILTLRKLSENDTFKNLDLSRIHFWFGDERYVSSDSQDRNSNQARDALLNGLNVPSSNTHEFPASDSGMDLETAARSFEVALNGVFAPNSPAMDLMILGMGPDGHVASLFPTKAFGPGLIVAEHDSPKPPAERLSMSLELINRSAEIVFVVSGIDKAEVVERIHLDENCDLPAAKVQATGETIWFIDEAAGAAFWSC